jgi:hypothetical protein
MDVISGTARPTTVLFWRQNTSHRRARSSTQPSAAAVDARPGCHRVDVLSIPGAGRGELKGSIGAFLGAQRRHFRRLHRRAVRPFT